MRKMTSRERAIIHRLCRAILLAHANLADKPPRPDFLKRLGVLQPLDFTKGPNQ